MVRLTSALSSGTAAQTPSAYWSPPVVVVDQCDQVGNSVVLSMSNTSRPDVDQSIKTRFFKGLLSDSNPWCSDELFALTLILAVCLNEHYSLL